MSYSCRSNHPPNIDINRIIKVCGVPKNKIRGIAMYGSQVYGTENRKSDFDFLVVACTMHKHKEFNDGKYNVHIKTPDAFYDELNDHQMSALECLYAPSFARIMDFTVSGMSEFRIDPIKLKRRSIAQSNNSWYRAKRMINDGDMYRGMKSLWHSLRVLLFADQILNEGCIFDFSEANNYWEEIINSNAVSWNEFKAIALKKKFMLENILKENKVKVKNIDIVREVAPNALDEESIGKLNTKRLLAYYKSKRRILYSHLSRCEFAEDDDKDKAINEYLNYMKEILSKREHL